MSYKIVADSCCDHSPETEKITQLTRAPLYIQVDGQEYVDDGKDITPEQLIELMARSKEAARSACPSLESYMQGFEGPEEDVYIVTLSAALSGSYNAAEQAVALYREEHPETKKNFHIFDSKSAASGEAAIVFKICELAEWGLPFEQVVKQTERFISEMTTLFVLENLDNLRKNGRLSKVQAAVTATLRMKLVMCADDGAIALAGKALSVRQALSKLAAKAVEQGKKSRTELRTLTISHCKCRDRAKYVRDLILKELKFKNVSICETGGLSTLYAGAGGVIVAF